VTKIEHSGRTASAAISGLPKQKLGTQAGSGFLHVRETQYFATTGPPNL
jgi:hypothetical protein